MITIMSLQMHYCWPDTHTY